MNSTYLNITCAQEEQHAIEGISFIFKNESVIFTSFSLLAVIANSFFLIDVIRACMFENGDIKRYLFGINRSVLDLLTAIMIYFYIHERETHSLSSHNILPPYYQNIYSIPIQILMTINAWNVAFGYMSHAMVTIFAIRQPLLYKQIPVRVFFPLFQAFWLISIILFWVVYTKEIALLDHTSITERDLKDITSLQPTGSLGGYFIFAHHSLPHNFLPWLSDICHVFKDPVSQAYIMCIIGLVILPFLLSYFIHLKVVLEVISSNGLYRHEHYGFMILRQTIHILTFGICSILQLYAYFGLFTFAVSCEAQSCQTRLISFCFVVINFIGSTCWLIRMSVDPIIDTLFFFIIQRNDDNLHIRELDVLYPLEERKPCVMETSSEISI
ncbi:unnamed protein product [Auanema sp. JU1783]|nr:unnamed protein product [Auanema sp. JU1783]